MNTPSGNPHMSKRKEIRIAGFGGQGIALVSFILGKALAIEQDLEAVMTQSYGPEARGGASSANIVVSDEPIDYPFIQCPDILVTLSQESYTKFRPTAKPGALIIIDAGLVTPLPDDHLLQLPATRLAEELGRRIVANIVMLGFLTAVEPLFQREAMERTIASSMPPARVPLNLKAFAAGYAYALQSEQALP